MAPFQLALSNLSGSVIEKQFSLDDLSLYPNEIANGEAEEDLALDFDDDPATFDILHHEVSMSREEYKAIYGDDYLDEDDIPD